MDDKRHDALQRHDDRHPRDGRPHTPVRAGVPERDAPTLRTDAGVRAAAAFVARIAGLDVTAARAYVRAWHAAVAADAGAWFAAEAAVADAVVSSRRSAEQRVLLRAMAEAHTDAVWYRRGARGATPERRVGATEASGQYTATLAMLALLARDHLDPRHFAAVYAPFVELIPVGELDEAPHEARAEEPAEESRPP